jgi:DNA replication protein DnaC
MERFNEIMVRQRRQQLFQQRARQSRSQGQSQALDGSASSARSRLPEQTARLGQPLSRAPRPRVQVTEVAPVEALPAEEGELLSRPAPLRSRPPLNRQTGEHYYHVDDYAPAVHGDVLEEEDWDEDEAGMRYGDWEDDEALYEPPPRALPEAPRTRSPFGGREVLASPARQPGEPSTSPSATRYLRGRPASAVSPGQDSRAQRVTQPLRPGALPETAYERLQGVLQRQARHQGVLQGQTQSTQPRLRERSSGVPLPAPAPAPAPAPTALSTTAPRGVCPRCKGAGYLRLDVPFGHPNFGRPVPCECKEAALKERRRQQLRSMSNLEAFRDKSFKNFNYSVPGVRQAYQAALEYVRDPDGWLLLIGPNGCGKTHLAAAIANLCLENGSLVLFATVPDLLDHLRAAFAPDAPEVYDQLFARMREAELLVLDDLGAQQSSPWANEKLFQLLNYRYNLRCPTVITANPRGLQAIDERIRSRLTDTALVTTVSFEGALDYRPRNPRRSL